jgi:hypothetical protein
MFERGQYSPDTRPGTENTLLRSKIGTNLFMEFLLGLSRRFGAARLMVSSSRADRWLSRPANATLFQGRNVSEGFPEMGDLFRS